MCGAAGLACRKIEFGQAADFRQDFAAFRAMGAVKVWVGGWAVGG